ncbi:MAG: hypothetical protein ABIP68_03115 [Ferruginibacter sp.]
MIEYIGEDLRIRILLTTYNAILGKIDPGVRLISIDWGKDYYIIKEYLDREVVEDDYEILKSISTEVISHFPQIFKVEEFAEFSIDKVESIPPLKEMVFLRFGELEL